VRTAPVRIRDVPAQAQPPPGSIGVAALSVRARADAAAEKMSRAALKGAIERACNGSATVIVDALNYIKGYRYELYCIVRATASTHCCVMVDAPLESAREWNDARGEAGYEPAM